jgi:hypothetical protein
MSYKRIRVWDGSTWQQIGAQIPQVLEAYGTGSVTLSSGTATTTINFAPATFVAAPLVFTQLRGSNNATIRVSAVTTTGFTVVVTGTGTDAVSFSWFAVQPE